MRMNIISLSDFIDERLVKKKVVRDGKRKIIKRTDKVGFKSINGKKEVKMTAKEKITRQKAQKIAALKRKSKSQQASKKRKLSMKKK